MKQVLRIVLILALVLLPFTPLNAYAEEHNPFEDLEPLEKEEDPSILLTLGILAAVVLVAWVVVGLILPDQPEHNQFSTNGDKQKTLLAEQLEQLEPIENVVPQTNFTSPEHANVHGAMYPVFEW